MTKRHLPPQTSKISQDVHGSPTVTIPRRDAGVFLNMDPTTEKSESMDTGQAEIRPSGMTEKKSRPEPHRSLDFVPDSSEFNTPKYGTMP